MTISNALIKLGLLITVVIGMGEWSVALAEEAPVPAIDTGDTAWILVSSALVLCMMLPGLALFYGGLVRSRNVLGTIMHTAVILCLITLVWVICGYSLAFGPDIGGVIGSLAWVGLQGVGAEPSPDYASTIPHQVFMVFQLMFAAITVALITGSFAERMKFKALLLFSVLWSLCIYSPLAHWVWGGGSPLGVGWGLALAIRSLGFCRRGGGAH
jgi:Amt family ammonium transporter